MAEAENHALRGSTNDTWRTWLMTGARREPVDRRRMRGAYRGLKRMLGEGMTNGGERPHAWKDFSGAMIRHAVDEAMRTMPAQDGRVVKLAYFGGLSNREIAIETGLSEATVQRRLRRALEAISAHIHRGRALGRKAMYALMVWLSGRWLSDLGSHFAPAMAAAAVTVIVVAQPAAQTVAAPANPPASQAAAHGASARPVIPPEPTPSEVPAPKPPPVPAVPSAPSVPSVPSVPAPEVKLPLPPLPAVPVHVPSLRK